MSDEQGRTLEESIELSVKRLLQQSRRMDEAKTASLHDGLLSQKKVVVWLTGWLAGPSLSLSLLSAAQILLLH